MPEMSDETIRVMVFFDSLEHEKSADQKNDGHK